MPRRPAPAVARPSPTVVDPAADAGALLRRVGFAILALAVPAAALVARRGIVVLVPVGVALLVIAAAIDGKNRPLGPTFARLAGSRGGIAGVIVLGWCALSLLWTPFTSPASERLISIMATIAVAVAGYLALPDRMRAANLYLIPIGVALAALGAALLALFGLSSGPDSEEARQNLDRGLTLAALLVWPAVAWLHSRGRGPEAFGIALVVALAAVLGPRPMPAVALAAGGLVFAITIAARRAGIIAAAATMAGLLALSPLLPFILYPIGRALLGPANALVSSLEVWRGVVSGGPLRLITGHGFETALRARFADLLPGNAPSTLLFEVWYELGIVGALAGAAALFFAARAAGSHNAVLAPSVMAAFATAYSFACLGIGTAQMWWFTALAALVLIFVAIERGQFRTKRPKARRLRAANDA